MSKTTKVSPPNKIVSVEFTSHEEFISATTENWEALATAMDNIDRMQGGCTEDGGEEALEAKAGIAYALLKDIQLLNQFYRILSGAELTETEEKSFNFVPVS